MFKRVSVVELVDNKALWKGIILAVGLALMLSACAHQTTKYVADPPGFWLGIWNGVTMVFAIIGHLMDNSMRSYAFPNNGGWYDFGYAIGVGSWGAIMVQ